MKNHREIIKSPATMLTFTLILAFIWLKPGSTASSQSGYPAPATLTPFPATPTKPGGVVIQWSNFVYLPATRQAVQPTPTPQPTPTTPPAPAYTYSRYLTTVDNYPLGDLGRERGGCLNNGTLAPGDGLVVRAIASYFPVGIYRQCSL